MLAEGLQVGTGEAFRTSGERVEIDARERHLLGHPAEHRAPALFVRQRELDRAREPPAARERGVEPVGAVCRREDEDAAVAAEAVHLLQQLVQLPVVASAVVLAASGAERVDLVEEHDRGRGGAGAFEEALDRLLRFAGPLREQVGRGHLVEARLHL